MKLCQFNGLVLFTQRFTEFDACDSFEVTETQTSSVICCPPVLNGNMNIYLIYNNPVCKKKKKMKLIAPASEVLAAYSACSRKLLLKKAEIDNNFHLQLQNQVGQITTVNSIPTRDKRCLW